MSDLHAEAPQPSRAAPYVRASRATPHGAADITTVFDQIFANAAQPAQQATPQVAVAIAATPVDVSYPAAVKPEDSRNDEDLAADEVSTERHDAPRYEALPIRPEQRTHAKRLDANSLDRPVGHASAPDRSPTQPSKQPRATDSRRAITAEKPRPEAPAASQDDNAGSVVRTIPTATDEANTTSTSTSAARRARAKSELKPTSAEATGSATAERAARHEPAQEAKDLQKIAAKRVDPTQAAADASTAKVAKQQVSQTNAVEVPPTQPRGAGAKFDLQRMRTAPVAGAEGKSSETPEPLTSRPIDVPQSPVAPTSIPAPSIAVTAPANAEQASAGKATNGNGNRLDQRATSVVTTPIEATREAGKSLVDSAKTAPTRARTDQEHEVDRVRLVQRVAKALQTAQDRGAPLRLRLTPPELGVLRIELIVRDGALSAKLEAETPAAKTAILENLSALRERLTAQGIKIERFDVDLMQQSDNSGGERKSFADAESSREQAAARQFRNERAPTRNTSAPEVRATAVRHATGQLNVLA